MKSLALIAAAAVGTLVIPSCAKESDFPITPVIEFKSFIKYSDDSADCIIGFKDGDGDIGVIDGDTVADLRMKYLYLDTTLHKYVPFDDISAGADSTFDTLFFDYRCPNLTQDGQFKALEGEIRVKLRAAPIFYPLHESVKFEIRLRDRAGHISNTVTTSAVNVH